MQANSYIAERAFFRKFDLKRADIGHFRRERHHVFDNNYVTRCPRRIYIHRPRFSGDLNHIDAYNWVRCNHDCGSRGQDPTGGIEYVSIGQVNTAHHATHHKFVHNGHHHGDNNHTLE